MKILKLSKLSIVNIIVLFVLALATLYALNESNQEREQTVARQIEFKELATELLAASDYLTDEVRKYTQFGEQEYFNNYWNEVNETKRRDKAVERLKQLNIPQELLALIESAKEKSDTLISLEEAAMKAVEKQDLTQARQLVFGTEYKEQKEMITRPLQEFQTKINQLSEIEAKESMNKMSTYLILTIVMIVIMGSGAMATFITLFRRMRPLNKVVEVVNEIAEGNLNVKKIDIRTKDEIGELVSSIDRMSENLRSLITQIGETSDQVAASSEQLMASAGQTSDATEHIAVSVQQVAKGADEQVNRIEDTAQGINDMARGVELIATNAQGVHSTAMHASSRATEGNQTIQIAVQQMKSIHQAVDGVADVVKELQERSSQIGQIVGLITNIAAQTNLLALNAAIEAARAGEHGRGFAVVASEVRKLAEQSGDSAQEIVQLIGTIQDRTNEAVNSMEIAKIEVGEGIGLVNNVGAAFAEIQSSISEVTEQIGEVSASVEQISAGSERIVQSIEAITGISEKTSASTQNVSAATEEQLASMEEIAATAASLSQMAEDLQTQIGKFKV